MSHDVERFLHSTSTSLSSGPKELQTVDESFYRKVAQSLDNRRLGETGADSPGPSDSTRIRMTLARSSNDHEAESNRKRDHPDRQQEGSDQRPPGLCPDDADQPASQTENLQHHDSN